MVEFSDINFNFTPIRMPPYTFDNLVSAALPHIRELMPWDVDALRQSNPELLLLDIREANEFEKCHIEASMLVPRGILETCCDWGYAETIPALVRARERPVVLVCRSGNRTALAALTLQQMGYQQVFSMKTGIRGWNDYDLPLVNAQGERVDPDWAEDVLSPPVSSTQMTPKASGK